jgi:hypothetical protein
MSDDDMSDDYFPLVLEWTDEDEFIPTEPAIAPPEWHHLIADEGELVKKLGELFEELKPETEEQRNQRIWEAIQQASQG